jgi:hypothetical protein
MVIRLIMASFVSLVSGVCYLAGLMRLMSALLICFGIVSAIFFGVLFSLPAGSERISFSVSATGAAWPFFLLALILAGLIAFLFLYKTEPAEHEQMGSVHLKMLIGGLLLYLFSLFFPVLLWFPSDEVIRGAEPASTEMMVGIGVAIYLVGSAAALYLLYRASRGATGDNPDLMRRFVTALFGFFHLDKLPALVAYLLIYSSEPQFVYPEMAALALAGYIPVSLFLAGICFSARGTVR